jgi:RNA polymerase sigma factor (sigma-70 family)
MDITTQQATFDAWLRAHAAILHHVAHGFATGADRHDLMQELMLAVWRAIPAFRAASQPSTFIFRVTHNAALTWKRGERNYQRRLQRFEQEHAPPSVVIQESASDVTADSLALLYAAIRRLEPLDRSLVLLHLDDVSYAQIAAIHGLSESNVGVRLNRIKHKLTAILQEKSHDI